MNAVGKNASGYFLESEVVYRYFLFKIDLRTDAKRREAHEGLNI